MSVFKFFDLFSQTPSIKVKGKKRLATIFGSLIGLISIIFLIAGIFFILNDYFSRLTITVNSYIDNSVKPDIDLKKFKLSFLITDLMGKEFPDQERLFTITAKHWDIFIPVLGGNSTESIVVEDIPKIKCNEYKNNKLLNKEIEMYTKKMNPTCFDFEDLNKNLSGVHANFGR